MFQAILITKSERESKMHQISIPEDEIRSILYEHYQQRQVDSGKRFVVAEENARKQILQERLFKRNQFSDTKYTTMAHTTFLCVS